MLRFIEPSLLAQLSFETYRIYWTRSVLAPTTWLKNVALRLPSNLTELLIDLHYLVESLFRLVADFYLWRIFYFLEVYSLTSELMSWFQRRVLLFYRAYISCSFDLKRVFNLSRELLWSLISFYWSEITLRRAASWVYFSFLNLPSIMFVMLEDAICPSIR